MNTREEKSSACNLFLEANKQLNHCCESACEKQPVRDYIEFLENRIIELERKLNEETKIE
jgi:HPt (histidine-containing phosphotransfer) domain-containing protein